MAARPGTSSLAAPLLSRFTPPGARNNEQLTASTANSAWTHETAYIRRAVVKADAQKSHHGARNLLKELNKAGGRELKNVAKELPG